MGFFFFYTNLTIYSKLIFINILVELNVGWRQTIELFCSTFNRLRSQNCYKNIPYWYFEREYFQPKNRVKVTFFINFFLKLFFAYLISTTYVLFC